MVQHKVGGNEYCDNCLLWALCTVCMGLRSGCCFIKLRIQLHFVFIHIISHQLPTSMLDFVPQDSQKRHKLKNFDAGYGETSRIRRRYAHHNRT